MTDLELLQTSCVRLPRLVELDAPPCIIANEIHILTNLAMKKLRSSMSKETRRLLRHKKEKAK